MTPDQKKYHEMVNAKGCEMFRDWMKGVMQVSEGDWHNVQANLAALNVASVHCLAQFIFNEVNNGMPYREAEAKVIESIKETVKFFADEKVKGQNFAYFDKPTEQ